MLRPSKGMFGSMLPALAVAPFVAPVQAVSQELDAYVKRADNSFAWSLSRPSYGRWDVELTSQTWQGVAWKHTIVVIEPNRLAHRGIAALVITGGDPNSADLRFAKLLSEGSGMPVATLFNIPNQPLWGRKEDDLIAHTFERFLATGDPDAPLLFPMVKSAIRAMDALQAATAKDRNHLRRFVLTGASKRGWTTWLAAATGDKRIAGIAPLVFDFLNFRAQLDHQVASWGRHSEMIADYTDRGLHEIVDTPRGKQLLRMVDPYAYRARIAAPTLIVNGANDRYWAVDALSLYWNGLTQRKWLLIVPNAGHSLGDGQMVLSALIAFAKSVAGSFALPTVSLRSEIVSAGLRFTLTSSGGTPTQWTIWRATSNTLDFRDSRWEKAATLRSQGAAMRGSKIVPLAPPASNAAYFAEASFSIGGKEFSLCSPAIVVKAER